MTKTLPMVSRTNDFLDANEGFVKKKSYFQVNYMFSLAFSGHGIEGRSNIHLIHVGLLRRPKLLLLLSLAFSL
jgi:hypothetical protein